MCCAWPWGWGRISRAQVVLDSQPDPADSRALRPGSGKGLWPYFRATARAGIGGATRGIANGRLNADGRVAVGRQLRIELEREHDVALERAALADRIDLLVRPSLDVDPAEVDPQQPREVVDH